MKKTFLPALFALAIGVSFSSCSSMKGVSSEKLLGEWNVVEMNGQPVTPSAGTPYLGFRETTVYGFTGCNRLSGAVENGALKKGNIDFSKVASTLMACPDDKYEQTFMGALRSVEHIRLTDGSLQLTDASGNVMVRLSPRQLAVENLDGEWEVVELDGKRIEPGEKTPFLGFDTKEKRIYGFTGCNRLMGGLDPERLMAGEADFSALGTTRMACHDDIYETLFLEALGKVKKAEINAARMTLKNDRGKVLLRLDKR